MKRRRKQVTGNVDFLPSLPAGNLFDWLENSVRMAGKLNDQPRSVASSGNGGQTTHVEPHTVTSAGPVKRRDMPVVRSSHSRNSFDFLQDPSSASDAMANLRRDYYAASSQRPRDALLTTWTKFHHKWYGENSDVLPLTELSLERVSCLFKLGGYKSFKNYLSRIKECHVEAGFEWTNNLNLTARRCTRSVLRGLGGPARSEAFRLEDVLDYLKLNDESSNADAPRSPLAAVTVGTFFLLRELELSAIDMEDVSFTNTTITLNLPVSKVDWQAKGTRRTWSCICDLRARCPVHILKKYDVELRKAGHVHGPWIISNSGGRCEKTGIVDMIRQAVLLSGGGAKDATGNWMISGHTFRITGARTLCEWGLDPITVQLLGRWGSSAVLSYLAESPLSTFSARLLPNATSDDDRPLARRLAEHNQEQFDSQDDRHERRVLREQFAQLSKRFEDVTTAVEGMNEVLSNKKIHETWWVQNDSSKVTHMSVVDISMPPATWRTMCGWKFACQPKLTIHRSSPPNGNSFRNCPKCNPVESDSDSSSSSESE